MKQSTVKTSFIMVLLSVLLWGGVAFSETDVQKVNINTADVQELVTLKYVGVKYAARIVEYREKNKFNKPEDIMLVKGIGKKIFSKNKDRIVVVGNDLAGTEK